MPIRPLPEWSPTGKRLPGRVPRRRTDTGSANKPSCNTGRYVSVACPIFAMNTSHEMPPRYYLGVCAIAKDETPFLLEWAAYHYYIGFEKFYIYDNGSEVPVRKTLNAFHEMGILTVHEMPGETMQLVAYEHCLRHHGHECEWLAFLDIDEFLCLMEDADARVLLRDYERFSGLALNWDIFSSSGHIARPPGMVTENYRQSLGYSNYCKSIVRPRAAGKPVSPHHFLYDHGCAVNTDESPALGPFVPQCADKALVNHYSYRSQQDYEEKMRKGDAVFAVNPRSFDKFYAQAAGNVTEKTGILPLTSEVKEQLAARRFRMRQDTSLEKVAALPLATVAKLIGKYLDLGEPAMAEVLFSLCYKQYSGNPGFLDLGAALFQKTGKSRRALSLIRQKMLLVAPASLDYSVYLECLASLPLREEAARVASMLLSVARHTGQEELRVFVEEYADRHKLTLDDGPKV